MKENEICRAMRLTFSLPQNPHGVQRCVVKLRPIVGVKRERKKRERERKREKEREREKKRERK